MAVRPKHSVDMSAKQDYDPTEVAMSITIDSLAIENGCPSLNGIVLKVGVTVTPDPGADKVTAEVRYGFTNNVFREGGLFPQEKWSPVYLEGDNKGYAWIELFPTLQEPSIGTDGFFNFPGGQGTIGIRGRVFAKDGFKGGPRYATKVFEDFAFSNKRYILDRILGVGLQASSLSAEQDNIRVRMIPGGQYLTTKHNFDLNDYSPTCRLRVWHSAPAWDSSDPADPKEAYDERTSAEPMLVVAGAQPYYQVTIPITRTGSPVYIQPEFKFGNSVPFCPIRIPWMRWMIKASNGGNYNYVKKVDPA